MLGILEYKWCLEGKKPSVVSNIPLELKSAVQSGKRIFFLRDNAFTIPQDFPPQASFLRNLLKTNDPLLYKLDDYQKAIDFIRKESGPPDVIVNAYLKKLGAIFLQQVSFSSKGNNL